MYTYRELTGLGGITSITLSSDAGQIKAGSTVQVTRLSGVGSTGPQGPAGSTGSPVEFLDGSLASNAAVAQITGITGRKTYQFTARGQSNANSKRYFAVVTNQKPRLIPGLFFYWCQSAILILITSKVSAKTFGSLSPF